MCCEYFPKLKFATDQEHVLKEKTYILQSWTVFLNKIMHAQKTLILQLLNHFCIKKFGF